MRNIRRPEVSAGCLWAAAALLAPGALAQTWTADSRGPAQWANDDSGLSRWQHFRLGALAGLNIKADFTMSGSFGISGSGTPGVYDDGYVRVDNTGNAQGFTSFWGYTAPSQISGSTLTLHQSSSFSTTGSSSVDNQYAFGLDLAYGQSYWRWGPARVGWEFGFGWLPIGIENNQAMPATMSRSAFQFDTAGIVVPTAPYNGGPSGEGPTIRDTATPVGGVQTVPGTVSGSRTLDASLYAFKLGPTVYFDLSRSFGLYASIGPALGLVSGDYKYDETLSTGTGATQNTGRISGSEVVFGGYVSAVLAYHFPTEKADIYIGAQYMPLGDATISGGGRAARLELGGQINLTAGINWPF